MAPKHKPTLGETLRAARIEAGLSIRELARLAGINHSYLVKLETDQNDNPSAEKLQRLAEVLEVDPSELLEYIGVEPSKVMPKPAIYFRRVYGFDDSEAAEAQRLIEEFRSKRKLQGGEDHDQQNESTK